MNSVIMRDRIFIDNYLDIILAGKWSVVKHFLLYSRIFVDYKQGILRTCVRKSCQSMLSSWRLISEFVWRWLHFSDFLHRISILRRRKHLLLFDSIGEKLSIRLLTPLWIRANSYINERTEIRANDCINEWNLCLLRKRLGE